MLLNGDKGEKDETLAPITEDGKSALAICRLAPQDYHRFHSPVDATIVSVKDIDGELDHSSCIPS